MEDNKKEEFKLEGILGRHYKEGSGFNLSTAFIEVDNRLKLIEEALVYLAEVEKRKLGIADKVDKLILPEKPRIIRPEDI